jgi:hypothetical protein
MKFHKQRSFGVFEHSQKQNNYSNNVVGSSPPPATIFKINPHQIHSRNPFKTHKIAVYIPFYPLMSIYALHIKLRFLGVGLGVVCFRGIKTSKKIPLKSEIYRWLAKQYP